MVMVENVAVVLNPVDTKMAGRLASQGMHQAQTLQAQLLPLAPMSVRRNW